MKRWSRAAAVLLLTVVGCSGPAPSSSADPSVPDAPSELAGCAPDGGRDAALTVPSDVYGGVQRVRVHLSPCSGAAPVAILELLHGAGADETQWVDLGIGAHVDELVRRGDLPPVVVIIPDAAPAYDGAVDGGRILTHLLDEIEPVIARSVDLDANRRAIGGISRGAALAFAAVEADPGAFIALGGHSPALTLDDAAAQRLADAGIPIAVDAGRDDSTADNVSAIVAALGARGTPVASRISDGRHDRAYWREQIPTYLSFYAAVLGASAPRATDEGRTPRYPCDLVTIDEVAELAAAPVDAVGAGERYPRERLCLYWIDGRLEPVRMLDDPVDPPPLCDPGDTLAATDIQRGGHAIRLSTCLPG